MKILVIGSGGREHAIIRKLRESPKVSEIYCAPGNGGIAYDAKCIPISAMDIDGIVSFALDNTVDFVFVAPDDPLAAGMVNTLEKNGIKSFGPTSEAAQIESSKVFSKALMKKYKIPTASYEVFSDAERAIAYIISENKYPVVIKADGLALGKGVIIAQNEPEAQAAVYSIMKDKVFGDSGNQIVVEEFLMGIEATVLAFTDGKTIIPMPSSKDHKRIGEGDTGPNTGGMGTVSPNPAYTNKISDRCMEEIFLPTLEAMNKEGKPFKGCLYFGIILTSEGPKVIEYNARFGDPEAQVVLPKLKTDLVDIICAIYETRLSDIKIEWSEDVYACVIMASGGYPGAYEKGKRISGLKPNGQLADENTTVYHAGDILEEDKLVTNGGRVLGVTSKGSSLDIAIKRAYNSVERISFDGAVYRRDIGKI